MKNKIRNASQKI